MTPVEQITSLYIGYFGRAPDPEGLNYWVGRFNDGFSLAEIAESFSVQPESTAKYPYLENQNIASPQAFITQVYLNLFNRVPDAEGLEYWTNELENGADVGDFILNVISGAVTDPDQTIIENKVEVGADFALSAANVAGFVYDDAAAAAAVEVINGVDETDASVEAAKAETDEFIADGVGVIDGTFTLTGGVDFADVAGSSRNGGTIDSDFVFTNANEAVNTTSANLNVGDILADGSTSDSDQLNVSAAGALSLNLAAATVQNIEDINITASAGATGAVSLASFTGARNVTVTGAIGASSLITAFAASGVESIDTSAVTGFGFTIADPLADQSITVNTGALADVVILNDGDNTISTGAGNDGVTVGDGDNTIDAGAGNDGVTVGDGNNTIDAGSGADTVSIGDGDNTVTLGNGANTLNGTAGGNNTVTSLEANDIITLGDGNNTIDSGAGNDVITVGAGNNVIVSGAGDDVITVGAGDNAITAGAGFDQITIGAGAGENVITIGDTDSGITTATADVVTGFDAGGDNSLALGVAGSATNYDVLLDVAATVEAAIAAETAAGIFNGTIEYLLVDNGADSFLLVDNDLDGATDSVISLVGVTGAEFAFGDIVA